MLDFLDNFLAGIVNRAAKTRSAPVTRSLLDIGAHVVDGEPVKARVGIEQGRRPEGFAILGKTGSGKSHLIRWLAQQDLAALRGFAFFDLHGDVTSFLLRSIAAEERRRKCDLSGRLVVIDPTDSSFSTGINPLEDRDGHDRFVQIAEFAQILKERWKLDTFGARTDELLRNALYVLTENGLTLIELAPFLGDSGFRKRCLPQVANAEIKEYFESRYDVTSDAMRRLMAEPVLNKVSLFVSDVRFRHLLGQQRSTFSLTDAIDGGYWIILNLDKGRLGEQAATFGSLFLTKIKHALFARRGRNLFSVYADEVQNLVTFGGGLEMMIAECRKRSAGLVTANQFLAQLSPDMQAAILSMGSFGFFQVAAGDAQQISGMLDGGKSLAERLKNLPRRHLILKTVHHRWQEAVVPPVREPNEDVSDLLYRSRKRWARPRKDIEADIQSRRRVSAQSKDQNLNDWE
jgi:hypothetical protein